jgi:hypothetical protein
MHVTAIMTNNSSMTKLTWSSDVSGAIIIDRAAGIRACVAAPIMNYEGNCSDMKVLSSSFHGFSNLPIICRAKISHFQHLTSDPKRNLLARPLQRWVLIEAACMAGGRGAATAVHGSWKMTMASRLHRRLVQTQFCTSRLYNSDTIHTDFLILVNFPCNSCITGIIHV